MNHFGLIILFILSLTQIASAEDFENVIFIGCYDGDTCTFTIPGIPSIFGKEISVRLRGIDTPEIRGKCEKEKSLAKEAKAEINRILKNAKSIKIVDPVRGKYFRLVATIIVDGININDQMLINQSYTREYSGATRLAWCD